MRSSTATRAIAVFGAVSAAAGAALAHPGHGIDGGSSGWLHYATDPLHVAPPLLAVIALALVWRRLRGAAR